MATRKPQPGDHRCAGIYGPKYAKKDPAKVGQQCERIIAADREFCSSHFVPDERRCTATYSSTNREGKAGQRCTGWAMQYQHVCGLHGGKTKISRAGAEKRRIEEKARKLVETYGRKVATTATEALLDEVQWTAGHVAWLRERVQEIETGELGGENALVWGTTKRKSGGEDWGETEEATPNVFLKLYQAERAHLVKVCAEAIKAGIEERRIRLAEEQGSLVAQAIRRILGDLNLTPEQQALVATVVPKHLRAIAS